MKIKSENGITIMVLVITIIIIAIIAGASVSMIFSEEGILISSGEAKNVQEQYAQQQESNTNSLIDEISEEFKTDYTDLSGANKPKLRTEMIPVKWDGESWIVTDSKDIEWYDYNEREWANVMLKDGLEVEDIENIETAKLSQMKGKRVITEGSMFVWIPRYAYKIEDGYHQNSTEISSINENTVTGNISVEFLIDTTNKPARSDVNVIKYNETTTDDYTRFPRGYIVHPAFEYGQKVSGIWVAKFEASHTGCTQVESTGSTNTNIITGLTLQVKPRVTSWRNITIGNIFTVCENYNKFLNSHLMTNYEWGAVAYFSKSQYGNTNEITINNSSEYITGSCKKNVNETESIETDYTIGMEASSTGNVYGVYDLSGGATEYVAGYINNDYVQNPEGAGNADNRYEYGQMLIDSTDSRKKNIYREQTSGEQEDNYNENKSLYGDAIWETSNGYNNENSWNNNSSSFLYLSNPFLGRGNSYNQGNKAGVFSFECSTGEATTNYGFRPVLVVL